MGRFKNIEYCQNHVVQLAVPDSCVYYLVILHLLIVTRSINKESYLTSQTDKPGVIKKSLLSSCCGSICSCSLYTYARGSNMGGFGSWVTDQ